MVHRKANIKLLLLLTPVALLVFCLLAFTPVKRPATHVIEISQMQFKPAELTVQKGDKVVFVNKDIMTHDATADSGKSWKSPALAQGEKWSMVVKESTSYYCSFHPVMKGKLVVKKNP